jgi:hypothetical protein
MNKIILSCVPLLFIACVETNISPTIKVSVREVNLTTEPDLQALVLPPTKVSVGEITPTTEPDPQALVLHTCLFENKYLSKREECIIKNKFKITTLIIEPQHKSELIGSTRGDDTIKTLHLQGKDTILLHVYIYGVDSIYTNVKSKIIGKGDIKTIIIEVKNIKDKIIVKDEKNKILVEYNIIR